MSAAERPYPPKPAEIYFFGTCLVDLLYPDAGLAAVELIERAGVRVIFPQGQTCCGQPAFNSGYRREAREVARAQLALFPKPIPIVVPSGSCGAMLAVHYPDLFAPTAAPQRPHADGQGGVTGAGMRGGPLREGGEGASRSGEGEVAEHARARALAARVFEWSDFLVNVLRVGLEDRGAPCAVTYHPSCHLVRELGVASAPLTLLRQLSRVRVLPLPEAEQCCGFGGTFSVKHGAISAALVADKCACVRETGADVLVSMDAGCLMNIAGALEKSRAPRIAPSAGARAAAGGGPRVLPLPLFLKERVDGA